MSALARFYKASGMNVAGYDRNQSELCLALEAEGINIHYKDDIELITKSFTKKNTLVVYTPAIPTENSQLTYFTKKGFRLLKRAQVLGMLSAQHKTLAVAGTHGKTTTSILLAHLFRNAEKDITAFLGGISTNYQSNFWGKLENEIMVTEADEFDRSFLNLEPNAAIITSADADHLDIYKDAEDFRSTFQEFANSVTENLLVRDGLSIYGGKTYGFESNCDYWADNIKVENHSFIFDIVYPQGRIENIESKMPGMHNIENTVAASALALLYGLKPSEVKAGIESFKGVKRRFEYHIKNTDLIYIDDYAHHPKEISALADSVRQLYPESHLTVIFQPHLFSRTKDFLDEFALALSQFDELVLMEIYPARERPIPGVNSNVLLQRINLETKEILNKTEILNKFSTYKPQVIVTLGAGDIDQIVHPLKLALLK